MALRRLLGIPLLLGTALANAGPVDPALFDELRWRNIGPFRAGRVLAVAGVPGEREHFYSADPADSEPRAPLLPSHPPSERDISTLLGADILTLRRHAEVRPLTGLPGRV